MFIDDKTVHLFKSLKALPIKIKKITIYATDESRRILIPPSQGKSTLFHLSSKSQIHFKSPPPSLSLSQIRQRRTLHHFKATP